MNDIASTIQQIATVFPIFLIAIIFHEFAHGYVASWYGDDTAKDAGRLTFNPVPHIDPIGTLVLPIVMMATGTNFLFGWAVPVPINPNRFRKYRPGLFWVSFAGPIMNFLLANVSAFILMLIMSFMSRDSGFYEPAINMCVSSITLNYALAFFNLIPLPPLDGSKMVQSFLSYQATQKYESISQYSFWILMALMFTGAIQIIAYPIHFFSRGTLWIYASIFELFLGA